MINCKSLFFKSGNPAIDNYDFFKRFDTLYDFLTDLLDARISIIKAAKEQNEMATLGDFVLLEEKSINKEKSGNAIKKVKTKAQERKIILSQRSVIKNEIKLYDKKDIIINAFINKNIYPGDFEKDVYQDKEPEYEEYIA